MVCRLAALSCQKLCPLQCSPASAGSSWTWPERFGTKPKTQMYSLKKKENKIFAWLFHLSLRMEMKLFSLLNGQPSSQIHRRKRECECKNWLSSYNLDISLDFYQKICCLHLIILFSVQIRKEFCFLRQKMLQIIQYMCINLLHFSLWQNI